MKIQIQQDKLSMYTWVLVAGNGALVATSITIWWLLREARIAACRIATQLNLPFDNKLLEN